MTERRPDDLESDLSAYLDGELDDVRRQEVERRLAESNDARSLLEDLRTVRDALAALPRHKAPGDLATQMARHAERRWNPTGVSVVRRRSPLRWVMRVSAAAAAVAACVFIGYHALERPRVAPVDMAAAPERATSPEPSLEVARPLSAAPADGPRWDTVGLRLADRGTRAGEPSAPLEIVAPVPPAPARTASRNEMADLAVAAVPERKIAPVPESPTPVAAPMQAAAFNDQLTSVTVVVRAQSTTEYAAAVGVVAGWSKTRAQPTVEPAQVDLFCEVTAGELEQRVAELVQVASQERVRFETSFDAGDPELLETLARAVRSGAAAKAVATPTLPVEVDDVEPPVAVLGRVAPPGVAGAVAPDQPPSSDVDRAASETAAPPAAAPPTRDEPPKPAAGRERTPKSSPPAGGRAATPRPRTGFDDRRDAERVRRDVREQHEAATAEPDAATLRRALGFTADPAPASAPARGAPPDSAPAADPLIVAAELDRTAEPATAMQTHESRRPQSFFDYLLNLAFPSLVTRPALEAEHPSSPARSSPLRLRVLVLPPATESTPPAPPPSEDAAPAPVPQ